MVKFRRSLKEKSDKGSVDLSARLHHSVPVPSKQAPLKVIRALYDYTPDTEQPNFYLSFAAGDYLHVVGREHDTEWYEATNPLQGSRGLVPVGFFEQVGKTVRDSRGSASTRGSGNHDSGYAERTQTHTSTNPTPHAHTAAAAAASVSASPEQHRMSKMSQKGAAPVYGVVAYDFKAERPDELDAKEGEAIIVIAQSNPEWFVAKPITRLGGPGLIPVSFIEIKDMQTGQTISDTQAAVARAGIPRVEEWKKMAAEYKNTSIPLGSFGSSIPQGGGGMDGLHQSMDRMSLSNQSQYGHARSHSNFSRVQSQHSQLPLAPFSASVPRYLYADDKFHFVVEVTLSDQSHWDLTRIYEDFYELQINLIKAFPEEAGNAGTARTLPLMPGPVQFVTDRITEGRRENLDEYLHKLLGLGAHISTSPLVRGFFAPRGNDYECDSSQILDEHSRSAYAPGGDRFDPSLNLDRYSTASHVSVPMPASGAMGPPPLQSQRGSNSAYNLQQQQQLSQQQQHHRNQSSVSGSRAGTSQSHYRGASDATFATTTSTLAPPMSRTQTSNTTSTAASSSSTVAGGGGGGGGGGGALKVKVWFDRDTCVVLRLPPRGTFSYADLHRKIMERRRLEFGKENGGAGRASGEGGAEGGVEEKTDEENEEEERGLWVEYRDEVSGEYLPLGCDEELEEAVARCERLTLVVRQQVA